MVFHGKGGYGWHDIYNMPTWLRKFTFKEILDHYEEEKRAQSKAAGKNSSTIMDASGKVNPSNIPSSPANRGKTSYK